jgi:proteasome accessory factor B
VRVVEPPEVREVVIQRLKEIATRHEAVAAGAHV